MPKESTLDSPVFYCGPTSHGKFGKYRLYMNWDAPYLQYKKNIGKKLYFKNIISWDAKAGGYIGNIIDTKQPPRIILETQSKSKIFKREFAFRHEDFENWLYWIIRGILKYSKAPLPDDKLTGLTNKHQAKVITRRDKNYFDQSHQVFVNTYDRIQQEEKNQSKKKSGNQRGLVGLFKKSPQSPNKMIDAPLTSGTQGIRAEGGTLYDTKILKKLGSGGSDTVIVEMNRLLSPILPPQNGVGQAGVRPSEPMAVKLANLKKDTLVDAGFYGGVQDLIKEARIMAALGKHKNIVGLIDAHAGTRFYLFMEKGYHDLAVYTPANMKKKKYPPLTPPQIRKYAVDILTGITHMHSKRIYHLDMKPENVILCNADTAKLIDFGLSKTRLLEPVKQKMLDEKWHLYGTLGYRPPESWNQTHYSQESHLMQRDDYAVGMTIFEGLLAHYCKWEGLKASTSEDASSVKKRIAYWEEMHRKENFRKKLEANGLLILADAAARLIDPVPANRFSAGEALGFIIQDKKQYRKDKLSGGKDALNALKEYQFIKTQLSKSRQ